MKKALTTLITILILLLSFSCNDDDVIMEEGTAEGTAEETSLITYEPISICNNYEFHEPENIGFVTFAKEFNGDLIYGGQSGFQVWDEFGANLLHEEIQNNFFFNEVLEYNNSALICTSDGVYKYTDQQELTLITEGFCHDIVLYQDEVIFAAAQGIFRLNADDQNADMFTDPNDENNHNPFWDLQVVGDKLFASTNFGLEIRISEYEGPDYITDYTAAKNIGLETITYPGGNIDLISDGDDLYFWTNNGSAKYLYRKVGDRFEELLNTEDFLFSQEQSLEQDFIKSFLKNFEFIEDKLFVGSNKGLFELDLASSSIEMQLKVDSLLSHTNINYYDLSSDPSQASYVVTNYNTVVKISCN